MDLQHWLELANAEVPRLPAWDPAAVLGFLLGTLLLGGALRAIRKRWQRRAKDKRATGPNTATNPHTSPAAHAPRRGSGEGVQAVRSALGDAGP